MTKFLLSSKYSYSSAKCLRDALWEREIKLKLTSHRERFSEHPTIRYGNSQRLGEESDTEINSPQAIILMSKKDHFSNTLSEHGIWCPRFTLLDSSNRPNEFPAIIRETLTASGGVGIHVVDTTEMVQTFLERRCWWTPFVQMDFELRVHIAGGVILKIFRKEFAGENEEEKYPIRNLHRGYHFSLKETKNYPRVKDLVEKIQPHLPQGSFFYALDIGWNRERKEYFVLEANSAPGLNDNTASLYAEAIAKELNK